MVEGFVEVKSGGGTYRRMGGEDRRKGRSERTKIRRFTLNRSRTGIFYTNSGLNRITR